MILAALIMHGFRPGPYLINETPEFIYAIFGAMLIVVLRVLGLGGGMAGAIGGAAAVQQALVFRSSMPFRTLP